MGLEKNKNTLLYVLMLISSLGCCLFVNAEEPDAFYGTKLERPKDVDIECAVFSVLKSLRETYDRVPLIWDASISKFAREQSQYNRDRGANDAVELIMDTTSDWDLPFLNMATAYAGIIRGNLEYSVQDFVREWFLSISTNATLWDYVGLGVHSTSDGTYYCVMGLASVSNIDEIIAPTTPVVCNPEYAWEWWGIVSPVRFYVDKDNISGIEDGRSWNTAFTQIQPAIDAWPGNKVPREIFIAEGTYDEERTIIDIDNILNENEDGALILRNDTQIYGGFIGIGEGGYETDLKQSNPQKHKTIIDGIVSKYGNCANHVVVTKHNSSLYGVTIRGGCARENAWRGGGFYIDGNQEKDKPNVYFSKCIFESNNAFYGGGIMVRKGNAKFVDCFFSGNYADIGGAVYGEDAYLVFVKTSFAGNSAVENGGAIYQEGGGLDLNIQNCSFSDNHAGKKGGAIHNDRGRFMLEGNTIFEKNSAQYGGALYAGGADFSWPNQHIILQTVFDENQADYGGAIYQSAYTGTILRKTCFFNNTVSGKGGAFYNSGNVAGKGGRLESSDCVFSGNNVNVSYGTEERYPNGGAIWSGVNGYVELINCTFAYNYSNMYIDGVATAVIHSSESLYITNSIFYGNNVPQISASESSTVVSHSLVQGGYPGEGNIDADPVFSENGTYELTAFSPCLDAGIEIENPTNDILGTVRPFGPGTDMGAYEFVPEDSEYTLVILSEGQGKTSPGNGSYTFSAGSVVEIQAVPDTGWLFQKWTGYLADEDESTLKITMYSDISIKAHFVTNNEFNFLAGCKNKAYAINNNKYKQSVGDIFVICLSLIILVFSEKNL